MTNDGRQLQSIPYGSFDALCQNGQKLAQVAGFPKGNWVQLCEVRGPITRLKR